MRRSLRSGQRTNDTRQQSTNQFFTSRFSPNGKMLAASSENCCVDFFEVQQQRLTRVGYITHIEGYVIQMDWSINSQFIRVREHSPSRSSRFSSVSLFKASTDGYRALIFRAPLGEEVKDHDEIEKIVWDTWTRYREIATYGCLWEKSSFLSFSTIGDDISGIWPKDVKKDHINCAHATSSTIVTGDDNGAVNLFKFPCPDVGVSGMTRCLETCSCDLFLRIGRTQEILRTFGQRHQCSISGQ